MTFQDKIKATVLQEDHPCKLEGESLLFLVIQGVNKGLTLVFSQIFWKVLFFCDLLTASDLFVKNYPCRLWVEALVYFTFKSDQIFVMEIW